MCCFARSRKSGATESASARHADGTHLSPTLCPERSTRCESTSRVDPLRGCIWMNRSQLGNVRQDGPGYVNPEKSKFPEGQSSRVSHTSRWRSQR